MSSHARLADFFLITPLLFFFNFLNNLIFIWVVIVIVLLLIWLLIWLSIRSFSINFIWHFLLIWNCLCVFHTAMLVYFRQFWWIICWFKVHLYFRDLCDTFFYMVLMPSKLKFSLQFLYLIFSFLNVILVSINNLVCRSRTIQPVRLSAFLCLNGSHFFVIVNFIFKFFNEFFCFFLLIWVFSIVQDQCFARSAYLFFFSSSEVVLLGFDSIFDGFADECIGCGSFDIFNAEIALVVSVFGRRAGLFGTLMIDDVFLWDDGVISHILKMFFVGMEKRTHPLWHFRRIGRHLSVD